MNLFIDINDANLLYERVFLHPYYRHVLLFYAKHAGIKTFTLNFKNQICWKLKNTIARDAWLRDIEVLFTASNETAKGISILSAPYGGKVSFLLRRKEDFREYRKRIAYWIRSQTLTPVAKHINKRVSLPLSALLAKTAMAPNHITLFAFLWSILGTVFLLHPRYFGFGFACFQINSILDGTDGEVAKMNFKFSNFGKKLDVYCDYLTSVLLMTGSFIGGAKVNPKPEIYFGSVLGMGFLAVTGALWLKSLSRGATPKNFDDVEGLCHARLKHPKSFLESILSALLFISHRDFYILAVFVLSLLGWFTITHYFLILVSAAWLALSIYTQKILATCALSGAISQ